MSNTRQNASTALPDTAQARAEKLLGIMQSQLELYAEVEQISTRQGRVIHSDDTDALMALLAEKQKLIADIDALSQQASPLLAVWENDRNEVAAATRVVIERAVDDLRSILARIVALEDEGQGRLGHARETAGKKIAHMQHGKALHKAYGSGTSIPQQARFKDRNG